MKEQQKYVLSSFYAPFVGICMYSCSRTLEVVTNWLVWSSWIYDDGYVLPDTVENGTYYDEGEEKGLVYDGGMIYENLGFDNGVLRSMCVRNLG